MIRQIYISVKGEKNAKEYYKELIGKLSDIKDEGYRHVSRKFEENYFTNSRSGSGKPFLLRFLLNIPKHNKNISELALIRSNEDEIKKCVGYLFAGFGYMQTSSEVHNLEYSIILLYLSSRRKDHNLDYLLYLPIEYSEIIKSLKKGDKVGFKGVLVDNKLNLAFDYIELT